MTRKRASLFLLMILGVWFLPGSTLVVADQPDISGVWYGHGYAAGLGYGTIRLTFVDFGFGLLAETHIPVLGLLETLLPATVEEDPGGTTVTVGVPGLLVMSGVVDGVVINGSLVITAYGTTWDGHWYAENDTGEEYLPGNAPGAECEDLPPPYCPGSAEYCAEWVPFLPEIGPGYVNYPLNGETWENQYRSYASRDLIHLIKYATAMVECKTADWAYGTMAPLGLGDMSEADGAIPGTSIGRPGHPPGSHENGVDIDTAYYQVFAADNLLRSVGLHYNGTEEAYHLTDEPYGLDVWRTALFIAYLSEHPRTRVIGVDGRVGPLVEDAFDELAQMGWIEWDLRDSIPLAYEEEDMGGGWFYFHDHHLHLSMNPVEDIVSSAELKPDTLNRESNGNYVTGYIELDEGLDPAQIDESTVALNLDGHTLLYAEPGHAHVSDYNHNGIADLSVKFDRQAVLDSIGNGMVEVTLTGLAGESFFQESDTILVLGGIPPGSSGQHPRFGRPEGARVRPGNRDHSRIQQ